MDKTGEWREEHRYKQLNVAIPKELKEEFAAECKRTGMTCRELVSKALFTYFGKKPSK